MAVNKDSCFELGHITGKNGLKGGVQVFLDVDKPIQYNNLESVFVEVHQKLVPFFIESIRITNKKAVIHFEDVNTVEEAETLINSRLYLPLSELPDLGKKGFYFHEIIGFAVNDKHYGPVGLVTGVYNNPAQDLLGVDHKGTEILVPVIDEIILKVDKTNRVLYTDLPEGLLEIYLP